MRTAVVTASYAGDFERCRLLCESMDLRLKGSWTHYILVAPFDVSLFRTLEGPRRRIVSERDLLPSWLRAIPDPTSRGRSKIWISPFGLPLRGWHVQQLRRFALSRHINEEAMFSIDSDVVLLRDFDPASLWHNGRLALYSKVDGIQPEMPSNHLEWLAHSDRLLGIGPYRLPATDYINTLIGWRSDTCRALLDYIENLHGHGWVRAIIRSRQFSECLIYGRFVDEVLNGEGHYAAEALCHVLWTEDDYERDLPGLQRFLARMGPNQIGIGVQSFVGHDLDDIRALVLGNAA
ncbi:hypothetical protein QO002_001323 [Pararhizobium capsulatum DSM 1112]|uniref:Glycosyl transferase family 8 n=1 Tax=Pararhizobium capsulatum DSM 1112 TaxID=1121113 RepID=A0ABU0BLR6_9HYPH|nr:DUF6492 family protein [Pararhizobium capsulatum]MDQ0319185.1 hypothetical protein [Pararhizobium capsulatum DSM 1112]